MLKFFNQNKKLILSFLFWLLSVGLFDLFFYLKKDYNYSNIESIFLLQIIGVGVISFIVFILTLEQLFHKKYHNIKARIYSSLSFLFFLILGLGLIFYPLSKFTNKENKIVKETQASKNTLIASGLKLGSTGEEVKLLQAIISTDKSLYPSGIISGYYGNLTQQAVINFQQKYHLPQTGEVDQQTADKINEVFGGKTREYYYDLINNQSLKNNQAIIQNSFEDPIIECKSNNCPTFMVKRSECNNYICCQTLNGEWVWMKSQEECRRIQNSFNQQIQQQNTKQKVPVMCGNRLEYCDPEAVDAFKQACENIRNNTSEQCISNAVSICYSDCNWDDNCAKTCIEEKKRPCEESFNFKIQLFEGIIKNHCR